MSFIGRLIASFLLKTSGLKTYIGLLGGLLTFLMGPDVAAVLPANIEAIVIKIFGVLVALGLAHKADKAIAAISTAPETAPVTKVRSQNWSGLCYRCWSSSDSHRVLQFHGAATERCRGWCTA
jgi:hypothetical protein